MMEYWVTPGGTVVSTRVGSEQAVTGTASVCHAVLVRSLTGDERSVRVTIDEPAFVNQLRLGNGLPALGVEERARIAWLAAVRAVDSEPEFFGSGGEIAIELGFEEIAELERGARITDRSLRRYLARRLYLFWQESPPYSDLTFEERDTLATGADPSDFLRNLHMLAQEGYVDLDGTHDPGFAGFSARPTARLIRDVERYGAAAPDVETRDDYVARLTAVAGLADDRAAILVERQRYEVALTTLELTSVFRALVPILEGVIRRLLQAHGTTRDFTNLGPMIQDMAQRRLGTLGLRSQVSAVQTAARDISLHGEHVPPTVLRIATETVFELFPQIGVLFNEISA